jgi:integrase
MELQTIRKNTLTFTNILAEYQHDIILFNRFIADKAICQDTIKEYFQDMKNRGLSIATIQRRKCSLKAALKQAMGSGARLADIAELDSFFKEIKTGKRDMEIGTEKTLSKEELRELIQTAGIKTRLLIQGLYATAGRISELLNIKFTDCEIRRDGVVIKVIGKGMKQGKKFMSIDLFREIKKTYKGKVFLFENRQKKHKNFGQPISRYTALTMIKRAARKIDRPDIGCHSVRHTFATLSLPILGLAKVANYLMHADKSTCAKFYIHGKPEMADILAINQLNASI